MVLTVIRGCLFENRASNIDIWDSMMNAIDIEKLARDKARIMSSIPT